MGLSDVLNTARDALTAQTFGLTVTGQNVSNVNTPGYVRREAILETRVLGTQNHGSVLASGLRRTADAFVDQRRLELTGAEAETQTEDDLLGRVEAIFDDFDGAGLSGELDALFSSLTDLAALPSDTTTRSAVLMRAEELSGRVRQIDGELSDFRSELFVQAQQVVAQINGQVDAIAKISGEINAAQIQGEEPADLKDRRDVMLTELSKLVDVTTFTDGQGQLVVRGAGVTFVQADVAQHLALDLESDGSIEVLARDTSESGGDVTRFVAGGQLAGLIQVRDVDVREVRGQLDGFAFQLAGAVNAQHSAGFGLDGVSGRALFAVSATEAGAAASLTVHGDVAGQPDRLAAASDAALVPGDATNAVRLARLAETPLSGGRTPAQAYADLVGDVGSRKQGSERTLATRQAMSSQVQTLRDSISGVSLDEEMVALTKFQRAFEAASRVLTTADELLADLINRLGR